MEHENFNQPSPQKIVSPTQSPQKPGINLWLISICTLIGVVILGTWIYLITKSSITTSRKMPADKTTTENEIILTKQAKPVRLYLGVEYRMVSKLEEDVQTSAIGANVLHVVKDSPAEIAGIQTDDTITAIDNQQIDPNTLNSLTDILQTKRAGQTISISYIRFVCDDHTKGSVACQIYKKISGNINATVIQQPSPDNDPNFDILTNIPSWTPQIKWQDPRPDDYWDANNSIDLTGFSITGTLEISDSSTDPLAPPINDTQLQQMGWIQNKLNQGKGPLGFQKDFIKIMSSKKQILLYRITDNTGKYDNSTGKVTRTCPCTITYFIFEGFPTPYSPTPTIPIPSISPTGFNSL